MNRLKSLLYILVFGGLFAVLPGCQDDILYSVDGGAGGMTIVSLEASFSPFAGGELSRASNVAPARGFNSISDMVILAFSSADGKLVKIDEPTGYEVKDADRVNADASNGASAETDTKTVRNFSLKLPFGQYYIVAVANLGQYHIDASGNIIVEKSSLARLQENETFSLRPTEFTIEDLRAIRVDWDEDNYLNNRAMLGYFAPEGYAVPDAGSKFPIVTVDRPDLTLSAWMRRCASKITVDFDGSSLSDNIRIYIKDVRVFDIAADCSLGFGNPISDDEDRMDFNNHPAAKSDLISSDGSFIEFGMGEDYNKWPCITRQSPYILCDDEKTRKDLHTQDSDCLYFYENMQGVRDSYNRTPIPNLSDGGVAEGYNEKDGMPYGTFIEVTAHHISEANGESVENDIKYRFMLGKNVTDDFNAERNYHYKLTLRFLGSADDYHWHIDYKREEGFKVPNPWYVSYVYNHDAYLPFEFILSDEWEVVDMKATIEKNPWYPTTCNNDFGEGADQDLADPDYEITPETPDGDDGYPYLTGDNKYTGNGFLSLRMPSDESALTDVRTGTAFLGYDKAGANTINQDYFDGKKAGNGYDKVNHGERIIIENAQPTADERSEREVVKVKRQRGNYSINIPIFTREKILIKQTGYSGNNPFVGYQRVAKIVLSATVRNIKDHSQTKDYTAKVNVVQVRRVVNPKGVYRKAGNFEPFHVNLKFLSSERADGEFRPIISRGPWMAEVLGDANFITLDGKQRVMGSSRSEIDFTIKFNRLSSPGNKNAIVRIKYHNYTCTHLIFVRQGYDPQTISGGGPVYGNSNASATVWNTFNMIGANKMATDPRDEGSMFKHGALPAISSVDNIYRDVNGNPIFHEQSKDGFTPHATLTILDPDGNVNSNLTNWTSFAAGIYPNGFADVKDDDNTPMEISRTATMRDFEQLYLTKYIEFGYGVLYADGATETQSSLEMVNGWYRDDPSSIKNQKGMRGIFAYYWNPTDEKSAYNTKNIFFPIGRSGYGHRKNAREDLNKDANGVARNGLGILRYSCTRSQPVLVHANQQNIPLYAHFQDVSPLFEFLYRRMGAIYWARTSQSPYLEWNGNKSGDIAYAIDFNYFTFDVNAITEANVDHGRDACFVRTVYSSAED